MIVHLFFGILGCIIFAGLIEETCQKETEKSKRFLQTAAFVFCMITGCFSVCIGFLISVFVFS